MNGVLFSSDRWETLTISYSSWLVAFQSHDLQAKVFSMEARTVQRSTLATKEQSR